MATVADTTEDIVWDNGGKGDIQSYFKNPPWITDDPAGTGKQWYKCMKDRKVYLYDEPGQPNNVPFYGRTIYDKLKSGEMPMGHDSWPDDRIEKFRIWYNAGCRVHPGDPTPGPNGPKDIPPP